MKENCKTDEEIIEAEIAKYLDSDEYYADLAIEKRAYQEEDKIVPSDGAITEMLIRSKTEQLYKALGKK